jgi:predicted nucleic acid-binding protein
MKNCLFDTSTLVCFLNRQIDSAEIDNVLSHIDAEKAVISTITRTEVLAWPKHTNESLDLAIDFLDCFKQLGVDENIADLAAQLKREFNMRLADALIAATALNCNQLINTANPKDFIRVEDLTVIAVKPLAAPNANTTI